MSQQCPQCGAAPEQDYGVVSCQQCGSVLMIDMDGNIQLNSTFPSPNGDVSIEGTVAPVSASTPVDANLYSAESLPTEELFAEPPGQDLIQDLQSFADQPALETALTYTVVIECIDHADLREKVRQALTDSRFQWNADAIMSEQEQGRVEIKKVNAVKAAVLVRRLRDLPVKVSWRQYAYN